MAARRREPGLCVGTPLMHCGCWVLCLLARRSWRGNSAQRERTSRPPRQRPPDLPPRWKRRQLLPPCTSCGLLGSLAVLDPSQNCALRSGFQAPHGSRTSTEGCCCCPGHAGRLPPRCNAAREQAAARGWSPGHGNRGGTEARCGTRGSCG